MVIEKKGGYSGGRKPQPKLPIPTLTVVYEPPKPDNHRHLDGAWAIDYPRGTVVRCSCGKLFRRSFSLDTDFPGPTWNPVSKLRAWWNSW